MADASIGKITGLLSLAVVAMFGFAIFVMPPLYDVFCELTGIGGKTEGPYQEAQPLVDDAREVRVQFVATNNGSMPWQFKPMTYEVKVNPGQPTEVEFYAKNPTRRDMVAQAVPNVTPTNAAAFLNKTECFCFNRQELKAGEEAKLGLVFFVDPELPRSVNTLTLSYTLFDITEQEQKAVAMGGN